LKTNQSFGELALINDDLRSASILCTQDSHFAFLDKKIFMQLINKAEEEFLTKNIAYLINFSLF